MTETTSSFQEGLFSNENGTPSLLGGRCKACGQLYFPCRTVCVECLNEDLEKFRFGREGKLYSFSVSHLSSRNFEAPYAAGWVQSEEGIRVFSPLRLIEEKPLVIGMPMELIIDQLWPSEPDPILGYLYQPV